MPHRLQCVLYILTFGFVQNNLHIGFENPYVLKIKHIQNRGFEIPICWCWGSRDVSRIGSHHSKECCVWILSGGAKTTAWKSKGPATAGGSSGAARGVCAAATAPTAAGRVLSKERAGTIIPTTPCVQVHQIQWATSRGNWFLSSLQLVPSWIDGLLYVDGVS